MRLTALSVLCGALLLPACTGDPAPPEAFPLPEAAAFAEGTCELVAGDVLALGRAARALGDGPTVADDVAEDLETAQRGLAAVAETAEPEVKPLLDAVVRRAGLVRLAIDSERYAPPMAEPLQESYGALLGACTGDGPPAPPSATAG